ncbi:MAG TPA: nucleotidyl transferase AbiEii/AbiGii toxin family protein [Methylocystis sp.]|nr:nucleotidyl transferase AbiEii/AbiGii toxin family protein [Methylocystis sp.]
MTRAIARLESAGVGDAEWMLGGGTLLMLRYRHRLSRDIDIFVNDVQYLSYLSPRLNETAGDPLSYSEAANVLRLFYPEGEVDFLAVAPVIPSLKPEPLPIEGFGARAAIPAMPDVEILAQKLFYRAWAFTGRDLYDFATIARCNPGALEDERLRRAVSSRTEMLKASVDAAACAEGYASIVEARLDFDFDEAKRSLLGWIASFEEKPRS